MKYKILKMISKYKIVKRQIKIIKAFKIIKTKNKKQTMSQLKKTITFSHKN